MSRLKRGEAIATRFTIQDRLASGGMAEVYVADMQLARQARRRVALKRIHPHLAEDPEFVSMFVDEARIASQLTHPGVISVLDAVEDRGDLILVLDYVPGWDLASVLRDARARGATMPPGAATYIARSLAETLAYVHTVKDGNGVPLNIIHRDLSPGNVLVAADGTVRLLDFGVAKAASRATKTATRTLKGKIAYMAPEQVRGIALDQRVDLYALGLVYFEMLTGRRYNSGIDDIAALELARTPDPTAPSTTRHDSPRELDEIVLRLLAADPDDRYASAQEVADAIQRVQSQLAGVDATSVTQWVKSIMGSTSRPLDGDRSALDRALMRAAGLTPAQQGDPATLARSLMRGGTARIEDVAFAETLVESSESQPLAEPHHEEEGAALPDVVTRTESRRRRPLGRLLLAASILPIGAVLLLWPSPPEPPPIDSNTQEVTTPNLGQDETAPLAPGFLRITSTPPGAHVIIDGAAWTEPTPTVVPSPPDQTRTIVLSLPDYLEDRFDAVVEEGATNAITRELARMPGELTVDSRPSGAAVLVNDEMRGTTPIRIQDLPRDTITVSLRLEGHEPHERRVNLDEQATARITHRFERHIARGEIWVNADIQRVQVQIDGRTVSRIVPWRGEVPPGSHTVTVTHAESDRTQTRSIRVTDGQVARVGFFLMR